VANHAARPDRSDGQGGDVAKRAFEAMIEMANIDIARIEAAVARRT